MTKVFYLRNANELCIANLLVGTNKFGECISYLEIEFESGSNATMREEHFYLSDPIFVGYL